MLVVPDSQPREHSSKETEDDTQGGPQHESQLQNNTIAEAEVAAANDNYVELDAVPLIKKTTVRFDDTGNIILAEISLRDNSTQTEIGDYDRG